LFAAALLKERVSQKKSLLLRGLLFYQACQAFGFTPSTGRAGNKELETKDHTFELAHVSTQNEGP
jgi:hypothetical protein